MKKLVVASNMFNERDQVEEWIAFVKDIADGGILIVDSGSTDDTIEFFQAKGVPVIVDKIIQTEGYGPARNHLRSMAHQMYPDAHWLLYLDADERILPQDYFELRYLKDNLHERFDVIALPRRDCYDETMKTAKNDIYKSPDYQGRMSRLGSPLQYVRRCHEQIVDCFGIYAQVTNPVIQHLHKTTDQKKRDFIGKLCADLHRRDELGHTYPEHHKEAHYRELLDKEGLLGGEENE